MAEIFGEKKHEKKPLESVEIKNSCVLSWPKLGLVPKCHDAGSFGGWEKREHTNKPTRFMFYKYRFPVISCCYKQGSVLLIRQTKESWYHFE